MAEPTHCYLGILPGEVFGFIAVDQPDLHAELARDVAEVSRRGGRVERLTIEDGRERVGTLKVKGARREGGLPQEGEFFLVLSDREQCLWRCPGSEQRSFGGSVGDAFQARRCQMAEGAWRPLQPHGDREWVRAADVGRIFEDEADAENFFFEGKQR